VLVARNYQPANLVRLLPAAVKTLTQPSENSRADNWRGKNHAFTSARPPFLPELTAVSILRRHLIPSDANPDEIDPLYLFACQLEWEQSSDSSAAWEVISAARGSNVGTRAHARALLERLQLVQAPPQEQIPAVEEVLDTSIMEANMKTPYGLEIIESCMACKSSREGFFCRFSPAVLRAVDAVSHHTIMPAGALLFVEGQTPRGVYIVCSGKVKLYTTSKEGKVLILRQAEAGEVIGLSAAISGTNYETTAETAVNCQLNYIGRQDFMTLLQNETEVGAHTAMSLSREFQAAYRDIHDLVLARSSSGKLARLLLSSCSASVVPTSGEVHLRSVMTHEEMAQRIGSSRETVTRLLSELKKKRLIRLDGANLVIRSRSGLEALTV
jgi:CRP/FNR family cyclic AMP-dependent transcriptional regulator